MFFVTSGSSSKIDGDDSSKVDVDYDSSKMDFNDDSKEEDDFSMGDDDDDDYVPERNEDVEEEEEEAEDKKFDEREVDNPKDVEKEDEVVKKLASNFKQCPCCQKLISGGFYRHKVRCYLCKNCNRCFVNPIHKEHCLKRQALMAAHEKDWPACPICNLRIRFLKQHLRQVHAIDDKLDQVVAGCSGTQFSVKEEDLRRKKVAIQLFV